MYCGERIERIAYIIVTRPPCLRTYCIYIVVQTIWSNTFYSSSFFLFFSRLLFSLFEFQFGYSFSNILKMLKICPSSSSLHGKKNEIHTKFAYWNNRCRTSNIVDSNSLSICTFVHTSNECRYCSNAFKHSHEKLLWPSTPGTLKQNQFRPHKQNWEKQTKKKSLFEKQKAGFWTNSAL